MKVAIIFATLLIAISTSAFSQKYPTAIGTTAALPMKDFPKQCVSLCAPLAQAYETARFDPNGYMFMGCQQAGYLIGRNGRESTMAELRGLPKSEVAERARDLRTARQNPARNGGSGSPSKQYADQLDGVLQCLYDDLAK